MKMDGRIATLNEPYRGYTEVRLIQYCATMYKWEVEIIESGKRLFVYEDEFSLNFS
mgnify:FL=1